MKNWIPKKTLVITSSSVLGICLVLYFAGLFVVFSEIRKIENYYSDTESKSGREERVRFIKAVSETNKESVTALRNFFIQRGDEIRFIEQIEEVGRKSEIKFDLNTIEVRPNQPKTFKEDVTVRMDIGGSWQNVMSFVQMLEKMSFGVLVQKIDLDVGSSGAWDGSIEFIVFREK